MNISVQKDQIQITQFIWLFFCLTWLLRCYQGLLLFQLHQSPFISPKADNFFWLYHALLIPQTVLEHYFLALFLDFMWIMLGIVGLLGIQNRWLSTLAYLLCINYMVTYNSASTHHEHILVGLLFCMPLLLIRNQTTFVLSFAAIRYYAIFTLASAGLWKLYRGSCFVPNQMSELLKHQHIDYLISYPDSYFSSFISYLINHPLLANLFWYGGWTIELIFLIGFFTRRFDKLLGGLFILFFVMDYLLMHLCFAEFSIFALTFYPWRGIWKHYETI